MANNIEPAIFNEILDAETKTKLLDGISSIQTHVSSRLNGNGNGAPPALSDTDRSFLSAVSGGLVYLADLINTGEPAARLREAYESLLRLSDTSNRTNLDRSCGVFQHLIAAHRCFETLNNDGIGS